MSDAPETDEYCFGCDRAVPHCLCHLAGLGDDVSIPYVRTDLPPTLAAALEVPEVAALVEAATRTSRLLRRYRLDGGLVDDLDDALAALKGGA